MSLLKSLAQFQKSVKPIVRSAANPFFKSKYAPLSDIQKHIKPDLEAAGLVITQACEFNDNGLFVVTKVIHVESGESLQSVFPVVTKGQTSQDYGSAVSYAKRYSLTGLLNLIVSDEDDDGNRAAATSEKPVLGDEQLAGMFDYIAKGKSREVLTALNRYEVSDQQRKSINDAINNFKAEATKKAASK
jgi:hypothetical protein